MTLEEIRALWDERQSRYRKRKIGSQRHPLSQAEIGSIRAWRMREVFTLLPRDQRRHGAATVENWLPPAATR